VDDAREQAGLVEKAAALARHHEGEHDVAAVASTPRHDSSLSSRRICSPMVKRCSMSGP
jgi:hypothetical protein